MWCKLSEGELVEDIADGERVDVERVDAERVDEESVDAVRSPMGVDRENTRFSAANNCGPLR